MHRISVRAVRAVTLASAFAFAAPALAGSTDYLLKLGGVQGESQDDKHKEQIEILSYSWGATQTAHSSAGGGMGAGKVVVHDISLAPAPVERSAPSVSEHVVTKVSDADTSPPAATTAGAGKATFKEFTVKKVSDAQAGGVSIAAGDLNGDGRAAQPKSGSLSYLNHTRQKELLTPAAAGSLTVVVAPGHGLCTAGKSLGTLTLAGAGGRSFVLTGVTVVGCEAAAAGGGRPVETLSLNYTKIEF
jgi:type VI protein secretion system component Hcp